MEKRIDRHLPEFHVAAVHATTVSAAGAATWEALSALDLGESRIARALFRLRGMPRESLRLREMRRIGFRVLDELPGEQLVLGVIGRFWTVRGALRRVEPEAFRGFREPGYAKAAWDFRLHDADGGTRLETETRVWCTDEASRRRFLRYWRVIGPFSGLIRREALRIVKRRAEAQAASAGVAAASGTLSSRA